MVGAAARRDDEAAPLPHPAHWYRGDPVLIAGGGIGGLAAALALARHGIASIVLEKRPQFGEAGAGIQIGPNGTAILAQLGVAGELRPHVGVPRAIRVFDARSARPLARLPLGRWIEQRHGSPYWVAHRQDLHAALLTRARSTAAISLATGAEVVACNTVGDGVEVRSSDGRGWRGNMLVGADGLWSQVRQTVAAGQHPVAAGLRAVRATLPAEQSIVEETQLDTFVWLSQAGHVVHYPVRGGRQIAVVGIFPDATPDPGPRSGWNLPVEPAWLQARVAGLAEPVRSLFAADAAWRQWVLHTLPGRHRWTGERVALLGDAAHPILPFLAQGAVLALEDAVVLAQSLATATSLQRGLVHYERQRQGRAARVASASRRNGRIYHMSGLMAAARDFTLARLPGSRVMTGYDWLYGWRP